MPGNPSIRLSIVAALSRNPSGQPYLLSGKHAGMFRITLDKDKCIEWPYDSAAPVLTLGYPAVQPDKPVDPEFPGITWVE